MNRVSFFCMTMVLLVLWTPGIIPAQVTVSDGGSGAANGTYNYLSVVNGKNAYRIPSSPSDMTIQWTGSIWQIADGSNSSVYYTNSANSSLPPDVGWVVGVNGTAPAAVAAGDISSQLVGDGTSEHPYQIATLNALYWIAVNVSSWDKHFTQTATINAAETSTWFGGAGWSPIGNLSTSFTGTYDGGSHTISDLSIGRSGTDYIGLFGLIQESSIQDLTMTNVNITGSTNVGGIVGYTYLNSAITRCSSTGSVTGTNNAGGLSGYLHTFSTLDRCFSRCTVTASSQYAAGLVARMFDSYMVDSYASGNISSGVKYSGGLSSLIVNSTVTNCYTIANVQAANPSSRGGMFGEASGSAVNNCFWDPVSAGVAVSAGGTAKTTEEMNTNVTFLNAGWSSAIWSLDWYINNGYPYFVWEYPAGTPLPAEVHSFIASAIEGSVLLTWRTASELNNYGFDVERRTVAIGPASAERWDRIGFVEGNGTQHAPREYMFRDRNSESGTYSYRLKQIDRDGKFTYSSIVEATLTGVGRFALQQNYPNPFNPATTITYQVPAAGLVTLTIYDAAGREVATLVRSVKAAGEYSVPWDAAGQPSGIYLCRLTAGGFSSVKKLMLVR